MQLSQLIKGLNISQVQGSLDVDITSIAYDSRKVMPGSIFVAIPGQNMDGHNFIKDAIEREARAIVVERNGRDYNNLPVIRVTSSRETLARLSASFYDYPCTKLNLVGITGTKGKTTTLYLLESIFKAAGFKTGILSTVESKIGAEIIPARLTTPEAPDLQAILSRMVKAGITHVPLEATSHALAMNRLLGCDFDRAVFTNISHDHLDFHGTFDNYRDAKLKLFDMIKPSSVSLVNIDDWSANYFLDRVKGQRLTYGIKGNADVMARDIYNIGIKMTTFKLQSAAGGTQIETHLVGLFNVYNILAAAACGLSYGISPVIIKKAIKETASIPGRFEKIDCGQDFAVVVDFAHSPESMRNLLETARAGTNARVILVFGCPGDRDRVKRSILGEMAAKLADFSIVTNDNPQNEDPEQIIDEVEVGLIKGGALEGRNYIRIDGRKTAIQHAINMAAKDDSVIIAGRGHEQYQDFHGIKIDLDDRYVARHALKERFG